MSSAADTTDPVDRFLRVLVRSGLFDRDRLEGILADCPNDQRSTPESLAEWLTAYDHLTHFQAGKLLAGTWQGLVLGPFHVLAPLGRGGMGTVYLARNTKTDDPKSSLIALKILPPKRAKAEERNLARFQREMELSRRVVHPHLTRTFEAGIIDGIWYLSMEYIPGMTLSKWVTQRGPMPIGHAAAFFAEVAAGLHAAHQEGLIHRDLKPSNLMITPNGHAKILDLGLALVEGEKLPDDKSIVGGAGYIVGTMDYISPEQADDPTRIDVRADIYSLGCTIYFSLTGQPPFPGGKALDKIRRHLSEMPALITDLNPTVPREFSRIVESLMAKDRRHRPESAEAVRKLLLPFAEAIHGPVEGPISGLQALHDLERRQAAEPSVWESFSPIAFAATTANQRASTATNVPLVPPPTAAKTLTPKQAAGSLPPNLPTEEPLDQPLRELPAVVWVIGGIVGFLLLLLFFDRIRG